uniref:Integral membrane protein n=1 Tax=Steinernema glaseri TaxID=37863 RepID=A0A1I7YLR1_9BILA
RQAHPGLGGGGPPDRGGGGTPGGVLAGLAGKYRSGAHPRVAGGLQPAVRQGRAGPLHRAVGHHDRGRAVGTPGGGLRRRPGAAPLAGGRAGVRGGDGHHRAAQPCADPPWPGRQRAEHLCVPGQLFVPPSFRALVHPGCRRAGQDLRTGELPRHARLRERRGGAGADATQHAREHAGVRHGQRVADVATFSLPAHLAGMAQRHGVAQPGDVRETAGGAGRGAPIVRRGATA